MPAEPPPSDPSAEPESLLTATLLACTAGLLDAATYLLHGHVFATAMTGNTVLLGISAVSGNWNEFARHVTPIAAYLAGIALSRFSRNTLGGLAPAAALLLEALALVASGLLPKGFPETIFTAAISFVCALQVATLRQVGPFSYNSTFITGDLRDAVEGLYDWLVARHPSIRSPASIAPDQGRARGNARLQARDLFSVWLGFLGGATAGALAAARLGNHTYWIPVPILLGLIPAILHRVRQHRRAVA